MDDQNKEKQPDNRPDVPESDVTTSVPVETEPASDPSAAPVESAEPEQPAAETPSTFTPVVPPQKPNKKRGKLIAIIVAVLVVLLGGVAAAYKFVYQDPENVVSDAMTHALMAKSISFKTTAEYKGKQPVTITLNGAAKDGSMNVDVEVKTTDGDKDVSFKGSALYSGNGDLYVKVGNADDIVNNLMGLDSAKTSDGMKKIVNDFVAKVNDHWIKISSDDLKSFSEEAAKAQKCMQDSVKKLQQDNGLSTELSDLYKKHKFITVAKELGSQGNSLGYEIVIVPSESNAFFAGLKDTQFYRNLHACDSNITLDEHDVVSSSESSDLPTVNVWISRFSHDITKLTVSSNDKDAPVDVTLEPTFNQPVSITAPTDAKSLGDFQKDIEDLQSALMREYMKSMMGPNSMETMNMPVQDTGALSSPL